MTMYHPLAKELEAYWKTLEDGSDEQQGFHEAFNRRLIDKFDEKSKPHSNEGRFGMSKASGCTRAAGLKFLGHKGEDFSGSTKLTFWTGHMIEVMALASLERMGYISPADESQTVAKIDPFMHSYSDGNIVYPRGSGYDLVLSVKSIGYKMSGKRGNNWTRQGFSALPFGGIKKEQKSWYAQSQAEMHGTGKIRTLLIAVAKDTVKKFEEDEFLGPNGNGSLAFYVEEIPYDQEWCEKYLVPTWQFTWDSVQRGEAGVPFVLNKDTYRYGVLEKASTGPGNRLVSGDYNSCLYCDLVKICPTVP